MTSAEDPHRNLYRVARGLQIFNWALLLLSLGNALTQLTRS